MSNQNGLVKKLDKVAYMLEKPLEVCVGIFLSIIAIAVFTGVISRNIDLPIVWLGELSVYAAIWTTFFGFALAYRYDMFANVDVITKSLTENGVYILELIWNMFAIVFMIVVAWSSKDFILHVMKTGTKSAEMRIPLYIVYMGPVISYIITIYFGVVKLLKQISKLRQRSNNLKNV